MSHSHSHGHHGHDGHDHSDDITPALQLHLYSQIDFDNIETLNEENSNSGAAIVQKPWAARLQVDPELASDTDEQLLMHIPFTGQVRLHNILIRSPPTSSAPKTLKVFVNRPELDFTTASDLPPVQEFALSQTSEIQDIAVRRGRFATTQHLTLFFVDNFGNGEQDVTRISYVGFKGEYLKLNKEPINFLYEAAANPGDHKAIVGTKTTMGNGSSGGPRS